MHGLKSYNNPKDNKWGIQELYAHEWGSPGAPTARSSYGTAGLSHEWAYIPFVPHQLCFGFIILSPALFHAFSNIHISSFQSFYKSIFSLSLKIRLIS